MRVRYDQKAFSIFPPSAWWVDGRRRCGSKGGSGHLDPAKAASCYRDACENAHEQFAPPLPVPWIFLFVTFILRTCCYVVCCGREQTAHPLPHICVRYSASVFFVLDHSGIQPNSLPSPPKLTPPPSVLILPSKEGPS